MRAGAAAAAVAALAGLAGCAGATEQQSMLNPSGTRAQAVDTLWQTMLIIATVVWLIVVGVMAAALLRRNRAKDGSGRRAPLFVAVAGGIIPAVILLALTAQSTAVLRATDSGAVEPGAPFVSVTGHQYWWEVTYPNSGVVTANEVHIPTGQRVRLELTADDVIHSFWVPKLSGKTDMIPGRSNTMWLQTDQPGTYWGQCAEYCGWQHALMRFVVVAHEPAEFQAWLSAQAEPAANPTTPATATPAAGPVSTAELQARGREIFMSSSCVYCHAIAGTEATGKLGPDLTHLASREYLASGVIPNNRGNLGGWIVDPQSIKPGNQMPGTDLPGEELQALLAYLESLE